MFLLILGIDYFLNLENIGHEVPPYERIANAAEVVIVYHLRVKDLDGGERRQRMANRGQQLEELLRLHIATFRGIGLLL